MKKPILLLLVALVSLISIQCINPSSNELSNTDQNMTATNFHDLSVVSIDGSTLNFSDFKGKKVLCVNTASECGYTNQYKGLEELHQQYKDKLVVIGFPCNQFGGQEPGQEKEIASFCQKNYGVTFLLSEKIDVKGDNQHPVYQWLTQKTNNNVGDFKVKWNFNKFLIDENGVLLEYFESGVKPLDEKITSYLK